MKGGRPDGAYLYPAFPYPYYTKVTRQDTDAIYDYLRTLTPVSNIVNRNTLPFPFNIRTVDARLERAVLQAGPFRARSEALGRIQPRRLSGRRARPLRRLPHADECVRRQQGRRFLQGNQIDNWIAPNITNDPQSGSANGPSTKSCNISRPARPATSIASGPMKEVVEYSTSKMPDADLKAIAVYLKERGAAGSPRPRRCRRGSAMQARRSDLRRHLFGLPYPRRRRHRAHVSASRQATSSSSRTIRRRWCASS